MPATLALHDTVAVPDPVKLLGEIDPQLKPDGTVSVNDTVPLKPFSGAMLIVEVNVPTVPLGEDAATLKSTTLTVRTTDLISDPLVPVTTIV